MKLRHLIFSAGMAALAQHSYAGGFVTLPTAPITVPPSPVATVAGSQDQDSDQLYLPKGSEAFTDADGFIHYNPPPTLALVTSRTDTIVLGGENVGTFYDYVFRDTTTNGLVFGSKVQLDPNDAEINDTFRSGYNGYAVDAAWTRLTNRDLRAYLATRTSVGLKGGTLTYDPDVVAFRSDINDSEGNPWSGLYLIRTTATNYSLLNDAVRLREGGEEGQTVLNAIFAGYAPAAAVPEPSTYVLLAAGLGIVAFVGRRRYKA